MKLIRFIAIIIVIGIIVFSFAPLVARALASKDSPASAEALQFHSLFITTQHKLAHLNYLLDHRIYAEISAYSAQETCEPVRCRTASGVRPVANRTVACPRVLRLGTPVLVRGSWYRCEDRTHQKYDGRFDLFIGYDERAYQEAITFGIQTLPVIILN